VKNTNVSPPFIKKFSDNGCCFIFDVNTNQVVELEKPVYDIIDNYGKESADQLITRFRNVYEPSIIKQGIAEIENARGKLGLFSGFRPKKVTLGIKTTEGLKKVHETGLTQLVLQVTTDCNQDCGYCYTSGKYSHKNRPLSFMTVETCKKAIDFFCQRTAPKEEAFISFYGGEPLLGFPLIKEAARYALGKKGSTKYQFSMTTNGTLLNKEIIDFLIEHDVSLLVSLDGPEIVNDRYRFFKNGGGTFNQVMKNLEYIKQCDNRYFSGKIGISCVLAPPYNTMGDILDFFSTNETMKPLKHRMRSSPVDARDTTFFEDNQLKEMEGLKVVEDKFKNSLKKAILERDLDGLTIERRKLYTILYNLARRPIKKLYEYVHPFGTCHIGLKRLFVDVSGNFNICERVQKKFRIGSIDKGFDFEQIARYYLEYDELMEDCSDCWAMNHCERCWATIGQLEERNSEEKEKYCSLNRAIVGKALIFYTQLLREDPGCLKVFKDVEIS